MPIDIKPVQVQSKFPLEKKPSLDPSEKEIYNDVFSLQNAFKILFLVLDNTFTKIQDYVNGAPTEAPINGVTYGRKDAAWVAVTAGGGGSSLVEALNKAAYDAMKAAPAVTVTGGSVGNLYDLAVTVTSGTDTYVILIFSRVAQGATFVNAPLAKYTVPAGKTAKYFASTFDAQTGNNWAAYKSQVYNTTTAAAVLGPTGSGATVVVENNVGLLKYPLLPPAMFPNIANTTISTPLNPIILPTVATAGQQIVLRAASAADANTRSVSALYVFLVS